MEKKVYGVVYLIIDGTNDMEYIGQTTKTVKERFKAHAKLPYRIGRAIRKHGVDMFTTAILKECENKEDLDRWEKHFIKSRNTLSPNGYNLTEGGEGGIPCAEVCAKISAKRMGHEVSAKTRAILSAKNTGTIQTPEAREKNAESHRGEKNHFFGKRHTKESVMKNALAHRSKSPYKNLLTELDAHQISYSALAKLLGLKRTTISNKMLSKQNFTPNQKEAIKNLLDSDLPIEELFKRFDD